MSRTKETTEADPTVAAEQIRKTLSGRHICPYCGDQNAGGSEPCPRCTMEDMPATRQATKARIGPWYVLQSRNPAAPGMRYAIMLALISKGQITPRSIIRGPTTHQLWRFAAHVRSISREFGLCYSCGGAIDRSSAVCSHCQRSQDAPAEPDALLESRPNAPQMVPAENMIETSSYSARMRELNRRREQAAREATSIVPRNQTPHRTGSRVVSAMDLASAFQEPDGNVILEEPSKFSMRKIAAFMLFLIVAGAAAVFYFQPDYRDRTVSWMNNAWANAKTKLASIDWPKSSISSAPKIADATAKRPPDQPLPYSAPIVEPPRPQPEVVVEKPAPAKPAPQQASLPQVDSTLAIDQARKLWTQAIDSEARQDFAGAVNKYQQIKRLPDDAWPKGLQLRLDIAQRRAAQTSAQ